MITSDIVREIALSLPGAEEKSHFEQPDFRVRNKIFATLATDLEHSWIKVDLDDMLALAEADPDTFKAQRWGKSCWVGVRLAGVDVDEFRELVVDSWRNVAPKRLVAEFDAEQR